jgi:hypothetical protein
LTSEFGWPENHWLLGFAELLKWASMKFSGGGHWLGQSKRRGLQTLLQRMGERLKVKWRFCWNFMALAVKVLLNVDVGLAYELSRGSWDFCTHIPV